MKVFALLPLVAFVFAFAANAHPDHDSGIFEAREMVDDLNTRESDDIHISAREVLNEYHARSAVLEDFSTRELVEELDDRLQRRGNIISKKKKTYTCPYCGSKYDTFQAAKDCSLYCKPKGRAK